VTAFLLDLFAGPGGWDEGAVNAGFIGSLLGLEKDTDACATATAAGHDRLQVDVAAKVPGDFDGGVTGLVASPPCQSFSRAGRRGGINDARGQLVWEPLRWALAVQPEWVALEQVPDVLPIWQIIAARLREDGYSVWAGLLNAADYGVPQTRIRAVLIARREGIALPPQPTHAARTGDDLFGSELQPWITMADALGWSPEVAYRRTRGAGLIERHGDRPVTPVTEPAPTITGKSRSDSWVLTRPATTVLGDPRIGRPGHKARDKGESQFAKGSVPVTVREAALLQSFRADYPWQGSKSSQHQQVGNAIPPLLAAAVLRPLVAASSDSKGMAA
jgi:DNA (cytosine-5)-methyltransferase 1